jgi:hypothetical protein
VIWQLVTWLQAIWLHPSRRLRRQAWGLQRTKAGGSLSGVRRVLERAWSQQSPLWPGHLYSSPLWSTGNGWKCRGLPSPTLPITHVLSPMGDTAGTTVVVPTQQVTNATQPHGAQWTGLMDETPLKKLSKYSYSQTTWSYTLKTQKTLLRSF